MKYLVVGGNAAGMSFSAKLKRNCPDAEIIVIEKNSYVSFGACGLPYYIGEQFEDEQKMIVRTPEKFKEQGIDLRTLEEVLKVDYLNKEVHIRNGLKTYVETYDKLIISSGAKPRVLNNIQVDNKKVFTLASLEDGKALKDVVEKNKDKTFGIIGSGFIGLELLDNLIELNIKTKIFTKDLSIMENFYDKDIMQNIQRDIQTNELVDVYLGESNIQVDIENNINVQTSKGLISVDYLVLALGFVPNDKIIEQVEKLSNGAIVVNSKLETSAKDVYAIGDVATINDYLTNKPVYRPAATTANKAGRALADIIVGKEVEFFGMLGSSIIKIFGYELGRVGLTKEELKEENIDYKTKIVEDFNHTHYYKGQEKIKALIFYENKTNKILGIEMMGKSGVHGRLNTMSVVIFNKMTTDQLGFLDFAYAPPFSKTWDFLNVLGNVSK